MLDAFARAVRDHWPWERELLALIAEILHQLLLVTAKANGAKDRDLPEALRIPRPGDPSQRRRPGAHERSEPDNVVSFAEFARMLQS